MERYFAPGQHGDSRAGGHSLLKEQISIENDLPDEESQLLNAHVADCVECREKLAVMNAVLGVGDVQR